MPRILAFAGSTRVESFNARLVRIASAAARDAGAEVTDISLRDYPMPLLDQDYEAEHGKPEPAKELTQLMIEHDGFLIASPEYNSSISGVLKNTIDWVSRPDDENSAPLAAFQGKVVTLMSASPGGLGGLRGLVHVRAILGNIGCIVLPDQVAISSAHQSFDKGGSLTDENQHLRIANLGMTLAETLTKLHR